MYYRVGWMWAISEGLWCVTWNTRVLVGSVSPCKEHDDISLQEVTWKGRVSLSQCECDELCKEQDNVRTTSCAEPRKRWRGIVVSVVISMCHWAFCPSFSVSSWFSLLLHCINSSHSFPAAFFHICFHCILTAFLRCGIYSMWMAWKLAGKKILIRCGKYSTKKSICENQHLYLIINTWAALKANVISNDIVDNYRTMFESRT